MTTPGTRIRFDSVGTCIHKGACLTLFRGTVPFIVRPLFFPPTFGSIAVGIPAAASELETAGRDNLFGFAAAVRAFDGLGAHLDEPFGDGALRALEFIDWHIVSLSQVSFS